MSVPPADGSLTILLIEDEEMVREVIEETLSTSGFNVVSVPDAGDALALLEGPAAVSLVLTDNHLPGVSGADLAQRIRETKPDLPVLVVSGYGMDPALGTQGVAYLPKPFMPEELLARIRGLLQ